MNYATHQLHELRSLKMHRLVAEQFLRNPTSVIEFGLNNLQRWKQNEVDCDDFSIWEDILRFSPQSLPEVLSGSSEEAVRLRQSSPFAGLIPEKSRKQILSTT